MKNRFFLAGEVLFRALLVFNCIGISFLNSEVMSSSKPFSIEQIGRESFNSQASQDNFVYSLIYGILDKQDKGYYLEIGAGDPVYINNSYFFEKNFQWEGVSIDISEDLHKCWYDSRKNSLVIQNALKSDYKKILQRFPRVIDYLSLDVDGYYDEVLKKIPLNDYVFKVITIEHDLYRFGDVFQKEERRTLRSYGYHLLCSNVKDNGLMFEDWWIHPSAFPTDIFSALTSLDLNEKDHTQIMQEISKLILLK